MKKSWLVLIAAAIVIVVTIPIVLFAMVGSPKTDVAPSKTQTPPLSSSLPLPPSDPSVRSVVVSYVLKGTVQEVRTSGSGTFLMLAIPGSAVPPLPLSSRSKIKVRRPAGSVDVTVANLTQGSPVNIHALFDVSKRTWSVLLVEIMR